MEILPSEIKKDLYKDLNPDEIIKLSQTSKYPNIINAIRDPNFRKQYVENVEYNLGEWIKKKLYWLIREYYKSDRPLSGNELKITIKSGDVSAFRILIEELNIDLDQNDNWAIIKASSCGYIEIVELLLLDENVDPSDNYHSAIEKASENNHLEIVNLLIEDERVDPFYSYRIAITQASKAGHSEIVRMLLEYDEIMKNDNGHAIKVASKAGYSEIVRLIMEDNRFPDDSLSIAIRKASEYEHIDIVRILLQDERTDPSIDNNFSIRKATVNNNLEIVKLLLTDNRTDPLDDKIYPSLYKKTKYSRRKGFYYNENNSAFAIAIRFGHLEILRILLTDGRADPSVNNNKFIKKAYKFTKLEAIKLLLEDDRVYNSLPDDERDLYLHLFNV